MISKVFTGHSFRSACRYICNKAGAKVLETEGVRGHHYSKMADDFIVQQQLHAAKKQACFHGILSFYPGEDPGEKKMLEIARKYLCKIGLNNTQYAVAKHTDRKHLHLHIIANLVNNDGEVVNDSWIGLRGKKAAQKLTETYRLIPAKRKNLRLMHAEALTQNEASRYKIYEAILKNLPGCRDLRDLEKRLKKQGIGTVYKYKSKTKDKQGISFQIEKNCFKGSKIDRRFSLGNLEKYFSFQQQRQHLCQDSAFPLPSTGFLRGKNIQRDNITMTIGKELSELIAEVMKIEYNYDYDQSSYFLKQKKKKQKKRKKGHYR